MDTVPLQDHEVADEAIVGINVVPLVDIVLVLLIIFMVTATIMVKPAIEMELPRAETGERAERNQISLLLGADGSVALGAERLRPAQVPARLASAVARYQEERRQGLAARGEPPSPALLARLTRQELTLVIQADRRVSHGRVIRHIDLARKAGIAKYAFDVTPASIAPLPRAPASPDLRGAGQSALKENGAGL